MDTFITKKEITEQLEKWLKKRRDETDYDGYSAVDELLGQVRDSAVVGKLPWEEDEGE